MTFENIYLKQQKLKALLENYLCTKSMQFPFGAISNL